MLKSQARKIFSAQRKAATSQQRIKWDDLILIQFQRLRLPPIQCLFTYAPMDTEVNTDPLVDYLSFLNPDMQVAYPVCNFEDHTMQAVRVFPDTVFATNRYGTAEPEIIPGSIIAPHQIDMVLIPLLCFDQKGYRVGYGKGFYDKFLQHTRKNVIKMGLSYYEAIDNINDLNEFDVPLSYCITPMRRYEF